MATNPVAPDTGAALKGIISRLERMEKRLEQLSDDAQRLMAHAEQTAALEREMRPMLDMAKRFRIPGKWPR